MHRYSIVAMVGTGVSGDAFRPNTTASGWALVGQRGGQALIRHIVADGAAVDAATVADVQAWDTQAVNPTDEADRLVVATTLSSAQRTALRTALTNRGIDVADLDNTVTDRRRLFRFVQRAFGVNDVSQALNGFDPGAG